MIFLTVGTQEPFDRLVRAVDAWCGKRDYREIFAQINNPGRNGYRPRNMEWTPTLSPAAYDDRMATADLIVAHAGMGSIITALSLAKPILILPRRADAKEQRNDHQIATAQRFASRPPNSWVEGWRYLILIRMVGKTFSSLGDWHPTSYIETWETCNSTM